MRRTSALGACALLSVMLVTAVAAAAGPSATHFRCTFVNRDQGGSSPFDLGTLSCNAGLGAGLEYDRSSATVHGTTAVIVGPFRLYLSRGTIGGTYRISGAATGTHFAGTFRVTGGTGAYRRARGSGTIAGTGGCTNCFGHWSVQGTATGI